MNKNVSDIIKPGIILFIVAAVVCTMLAFTNSFTKDTIAMREQTSAEEARKSVFKLADSFEEVKVEADDNKEIKVKDAFKALKNNEQIGSVITVLSKGYGGEMLVTVGVNAEGMVTKVEIGKNNETPGLGTKAKEDPFISQFNELLPQEKLYVIKGKKAKSEEIEAISGATITSKAVTKAVQKAVDIAQQMKGGGK